MGRSGSVSLNQYFLQCIRVVHVAAWAFRKDDTHLLRSVKDSHIYKLDFSHWVLAIVFIPYTRPGAPRPWATSTYAPPGAPHGNEIVLGNNDVHYMLRKDL